jgi:hypothetical protein
MLLWSTCLLTPSKFARGPVLIMVLWIAIVLILRVIVLLGRGEKTSPTSVWRSAADGSDNEGNPRPPTILVGARSYQAQWPSDWSSADLTTLTWTAVLFGTLIMMMTDDGALIPRWLLCRVGCACLLVCAHLMPAAAK